MPVKITVLNNGPLKIEGVGEALQLCDASGATFDLSGKTAVFLCRCGASQKKPFCDGAHRTCNFASEVKADTHK